MYGWERYLSIEQEFLKVRQYVPYDLMDKSYSEFFTRSVILLGAEAEAAFKKVCEQTDYEKPHGNISQYKEIILNRFPKIVNWKCTIKGTDKEIIPFEKWNTGKLDWWDIYTNIKHNLIDEEATYEIALKMLGAYELLLLIAASTDPNREDVVSVDKAIGGSLWNELVEGGIKAYIILEIPGLLVPDIDFGIGDGLNGLPGIAFYPESVLNKIK